MYEGYLRRGGSPHRRVGGDHRRSISRPVRAMPHPRGPRTEAPRRGREALLDHPEGYLHTPFTLLPPADPHGRGSTHRPGQRKRFLVHRCGLALTARAGRCMFTARRPLRTPPDALRRGLRDLAGASQRPARGEILPTWERGARPVDRPVTRCRRTPLPTLWASRWTLSGSA